MWVVNQEQVSTPASQGTTDTGTVPVQSFNSNSLPVTGLERLEVLLDGAAAIYGADAVAGVVNTVLQTDFDGLRVSARYGSAEGTSMDEVDVSVFAGRTHGRGNVSLFFNYTERSALLASDQDFTATDDLRGTMAVPILDALRAAFPRAEIVGFDPVVPEAAAQEFFGISTAATLNGTACTLS